MSWCTRPGHLAGHGLPLHHPTGAAWAAPGKALGPEDLDSGFSFLLAMTLESDSVVATLANIWRSTPKRQYCCPHFTGEGTKAFKIK